MINGAEGIAVGMATRIPPHNPGEIIDATLALDRRSGRPALDDLMKHHPRPRISRPAGIILGRAGIRSGFEAGRGSHHHPLRAATSRKSASDRHRDHHYTSCRIR